MVRVTGIDCDDLEGHLPWASRLEHAEVVEMARRRRREILGGEYPKKPVKDGWLGPVSAEARDNELTLLHNIRWWFYPCRKGSLPPFRYDGAIDGWRKTVLAFSGNRIYIMQRDDPMSTPIPRLTDYEDVEVMIVARPLRGEEGMGAAAVGKGHRNTTYTGYRGPEAPKGKGRRRERDRERAQLFLARERDRDPAFRPVYTESASAPGVEEPEVRDPASLMGVKSTNSPDRVEVTQTPPRSRRRDRRVYSPITSSSDEEPPQSSRKLDLEVPADPEDSSYEATCSLAVFTKAKRKTVLQGLNLLGEHDRALRTLFFPEQCCVTCGPKHVVAITSHPSAFQDPMIHCLDIGEAGSGHWDASTIRSTLQEISPSLIIIAVSYPSWDDGLNHNDVIDEVNCHCHVTGVPYLQVDVADTTRWHQQAIPVYPCVGIGDISFISNDEKLSDSFEGWTSNSYPEMAPRSFDDVLSGDIMEWLSVYARDQATMALVASAFPGSIEEESVPLEAFDTVEGEQDRAMMDVTEDTIQQETELDEVDIPNLPIKEAERRAGWKSLPQKVRIAIRRLHRQFGHVPQKVLLNLLRSARVSKQYIDAVKYFRCVECEENAPRRTGHKTSLPNRYEFNYALGIDVLEILDADGAKYQVLNMICLGTCFQLAEVVRAGPGQPTSARCLEAIKKRWISWAGNPSTVQCDRGLHNRGVLAQYMSAQGIQVYHAPLETPEAIGRVERHGGVLKGMARKVISQTQARGESQIQSVLDESCLTKNSLLRNGGYSPSQWVLGKTPREAPSLVSEDQFADLGAIEDQVDPESRFAFQHQARLEAKKAFIHLDTSKRVQRALLRSAKPIPQTYSVGDVVCFRRDNQPGKTTWSPASRVIGHEGSENQNVWVLCENIPVLVSAQNIRPAGDAEALAHAILHGHSIIPEAIVRGQQEFEDATAVPTEDGTVPVEGSRSTSTHAEPSHEDDGPLPSILENEEYSEPAVTRERSRSPVPERAAASSSRRVSVAEPDAERTPTRRSTRDTTDDLPMQIRDHFTRVRESETPGDDQAQASLAVRSRNKFVAFMVNRVLTKEQVEHQRELKDLPGNLDYRRESPTVQSYIDGSRAKEWKKYEDFQAAIPLKGKELSDLLEAGHVPIPSKWVDTVKNVHEKHKPDYVPEFKSRLVSCGNFEDAEGVRTDAPTSDIETHALVAVFAACHGVPLYSSDIKNAYFQAMPIDRIVIMRQPQGGLPGVDPDAFLLIRVPVYGLCDSGRGFWKKVDHDAKAVGLLSSRIFPAFYYHVENGVVDVVLTTHVDDFLWACTETGHAVVDRLLTKFEVGRKEKGRIRFCGKQFDVAGHDILLDVADNTRKTTYIEIAKHRNPADLVTKGEEKQLRSVVGSLSWIARQARPDILYRVSKLQSSIKGATASTLKEANKVLELAINGMDLKLRYKNGPFNFQELGVLTASDASFAGEPNSRSQQGRIHFLVPAQQLLNPECCEYDVMVVSFSSTTIKRVCRATLQAETYALQNAQEAGDRVRALLAELYGYGTTDPSWHEASRRAIPHVMLSDCRSLVANLNTEVPSRVQDKRLQIELDAIRQSIFDGDGRRTAEVYPKGGDRVDWVATATQIADCLTKSMKPSHMLRVLDTCKYQVSREGYSKPSAGGNEEDTVPKGQ